MIRKKRNEEEDEVDAVAKKLAEMQVASNVALQQMGVDLDNLEEGEGNEIVEKDEHHYTPSLEKSRKVASIFGIGPADGFHRDDDGFRVNYSELWRGTEDEVDRANVVLEKITNRCKAQDMEDGGHIPASAYYLAALAALDRGLWDKDYPELADPTIKRLVTWKLLTTYGQVAEKEENRPKEQEEVRLVKMALMLTAGLHGVRAITRQAEASIDRMVKEETGFDLAKAKKDKGMNEEQLIDGLAGPGFHVVTASSNESEEQVMDKVKDVIKKAKDDQKGKPTATEMAEKTKEKMEKIKGEFIKSRKNDKGKDDKDKQG